MNESGFIDKIICKEMEMDINLLKLELGPIEFLQLEINTPVVTDKKEL